MVILFLRKFILGARIFKKCEVVMKSSVVFLGLLVIGHTLLADAAQVDEMISSVACSGAEEESTVDDSYQRFLDERPEVHVHSYAYLEGSAKEGVVEKSQFTLFSVTVKVDQNISGEILESDADIVCLQGIESHHEGYVYYRALKDLYPHFYVETCDRGISLIASKYPIENPLFIPFGDGCGLFDFVIINQENPVGHLYLAQLSDLGLLQMVVNKIENDYSNSRDSIPFVLCGELGDLAAEFSNFTRIEGALGPQLTLLFQPLGLIYGQYYLAEQRNCSNGLLSTIQFYWANILRADATILCEGSAEVSARQDTDGNKSLEASIEVRDRTESGIEFSGGVSGRVERDSDGNTSGTIEAKSSIKW